MWDKWFDRKIWYIVQKHLHYLRIKADQSDYLWGVWFPTVINRKTRVLFPGPRRARLQRGLQVFWREFGVHRVNTLWGSEWSSCCPQDKDRIWAFSHLHHSELTTGKCVSHFPAAPTVYCPQVQPYGNKQLNISMWIWQQRAKLQRVAAFLT